MVQHQAENFHFAIVTGFLTTCAPCARFADEIGEGVRQLGPHHQDSRQGGGVSIVVEANLWGGGSETSQVPDPPAGSSLTTPGAGFAVLL